jgi:hypothetical protein
VTLLTQTERDFLLGQREFTRDQRYYIKSRLIKKIRALYGTELPLLDEKGYLAACSKVFSLGSGGDGGVSPSLVGRGIATGADDANNVVSEEKSAGSGNLVPPSQRREIEGNISNPRVLSDMGLAIPRPTRLGDPRTKCVGEH